MKFALCLVALVLPSLANPAVDMQAIDDPPPEPLDCPLCAGNANLHFARTLAIVETGGDLAAHVLRF
jgi:hypothetical protein